MAFKAMRTLVVALLLFPIALSAQTSDFGFRFEVEQWPYPQGSYMNRMQMGGHGEFAWGPVVGRAEVNWTWWGSNDAKISGSLWNLEANKVLERGRRFFVGADIPVEEHWTLRVGAMQERRAIQHIWRHKNRHDHFPESWQVGVIACNGGDAPNWPDDQPQCPSLGYWDVAGPSVSLRSDWLLLRVEAPHFVWKSLTLPYPRASGYIRLEARSWRAEAEAEAFGPAGFGYDTHVSRSLPFAQNLRLGVRVSDHLPDPGWSENLRRVGFVLTVETR